MAHPLIYDTRRTFFSKSVLVSMGLLIAISLLLINSFAYTGPGPQVNNANVNVLSWYDASGTYHFLGFTTNQFGQPASGVVLQVNLSVSNFITYKGGNSTLNPASFPVYKGPAVTTNSTGVAEFTIKVPVGAINEVNSNYTANIYSSQTNGFSSNYNIGISPYVQQVIVNGTSRSVPVSPGEVVSVTTSNSVVTPVTDSSNPNANKMQVTWAGPNGTLPTGYSLYYKFVNVTQTCTYTQNGETCSSSGISVSPQDFNETNMRFLANLSSYQNTISLPPLEANLSSAAQMGVGLFYPNGTDVNPSGSSFFFVGQFYPQPLASTNLGQTNQIVLSFFLGIFGTFIPLIAMIGSYNAYGKDRISGVLESVLAQPVSRRGLSLSRFFSSFIAMAIAISISMVVVDAIVWWFTKSLVSTTIMLSSAGAFFVELAAFIGIMMLLSRVLKSSGALIGIGVGLFIVIDFFWGIIIGMLVSVTSNAYGSLGYFGFVIDGEFFNPSQYVGLVDTFLSHQASMVGIGGGFGFGFPISPEQYGITIPSLVATGLLWVLVPLAGFLYLAMKKD